MISSTENTILANKYQQKTDKQHILDNPDTYVGSIEQIDSNVWILNDEGDKIHEKNINYIPASCFLTIAKITVILIRNKNSIVAYLIIIVIVSFNQTDNFFKNIFILY